MTDKPVDDQLWDELLRMTQEGLVALEGDKVTLTDEGRAALEKMKSDQDRK